MHRCIVRANLVLADVVQVVAADDDGALHLVRAHDTCKQKAGSAEGGRTISSQSRQQSERERPRMEGSGIPRAAEDRSDEAASRPTRALKLRARAPPWQAPADPHAISFLLTLQTSMGRQRLQSGVHVGRATVSEVAPLTLASRIRQHRTCIRDRAAMDPLPHG